MKGGCFDYENLDLDYSVSHWGVRLVLLDKMQCIVVQNEVLVGGAVDVGGVVVAVTKECATYYLGSWDMVHSSPHQGSEDSEFACYAPGMGEGDHDFD